MHQTNQIKIHKEDLKTWGITLGLKTEGDTQGFPCILRDLINNDNRGIKHDFPFINKKICKVPREVLKTKGEARGFHTSQNQTPNQTFLKPNQSKIRKEDLKTWGITLSLKTEGDT